MSLKLYTAPVVEPVHVDEARLHLRVDITDDDDLIRNLIIMARQKVEQITQHALITQTWDLYMDAFPGTSTITLPLPPLQSVTGIYYTPNGSTEQTYSSSNYLVDIYSTPGRIVLQSTSSWPGDELQEVNGVRVRFVCGFGDEGQNVDYRLRQAMLLLIGHYYENREAVFTGRTPPVALPMGLHNLTWEYRARMVKF